MFKDGYDDSSPIFTVHSKNEKFGYSWKLVNLLGKIFKPKFSMIEFLGKIEKSQGDRIELVVDVGRRKLFSFYNHFRNIEQIFKCQISTNIWQQQIGETKTSI